MASKQAGADVIKAIRSGNLLAVKAFLQDHPDALNRVRSPLPSPSLSALSGMGKVKEKEEEELTIMGMLFECK